MKLTPLKTVKVIRDGAAIIVPAMKSFDFTDVEVKGLVSQWGKSFFAERREDKKLADKQPQAKIEQTQAKIEKTEE